MEKSINSVTLSGTLQECVVRYTPGGDPVCNGTLLVMEGKGDKPKKQWLRIVLWRGLAEKVAELPKDAKVRIAGRLETVSWPDKETGKKNYRVQVVCDSLEPIQHLQEIPLPKEKPTDPRNIGGKAVAEAILRPHSSAITAASPITDEDIPF
jgi:single stranded DNA-binding protein